MRKKQLLAVLMLYSCLIFGQNVTIKANKPLLKDVFASIEKQVDLKFAYSSGSNIENSTVNTNLDFKDESLTNVLKVLEKNTDCSFEVSGNNIVVTKQETKQTTSTISGIVTDDEGKPLAGATISVNGTVANVVTDEAGKFSIEAPEKGEIEVSFVGYETQTINIVKKKTLNIVLVTEAKALNEVVVTGYASQKKKEITGSIATMKVSEDMRLSATTSAGNLLTGRIAGVNVGTPSGVPGENPSITIRTGTHWRKDDGSLSDTQPVTYVIDGVIRGSGDFNNLSPNEIETITVLKDAAAAAVYGSRSDGGVILVTTKRGVAGKVRLDYSYSYAINTRTENIARTSAVETGELYNRLNGMGGFYSWSQEELDHYKNNVNGGWGYDQLETVWRNPTLKNHNLSVSGGSEKIKYFGAVSYAMEEGFLAPLTYDKLNIRFNTTANITENLQFFGSFGMSDNDQSTTAFDGPDDWYRKLLVWQPDQPVYTDGGQPMDYGWTTNVGAVVDGKTGYNKSNFRKPQMLANLTYKFPFLEGLSAKVAFSNNWSNSVNSVYRTKIQMAQTVREGAYGHIVRTDDASITGYVTSSNPSKEFLYKQSVWAEDYQLNLQMNYNNIFKDVHTVQGTVVYERTEANGDNVYGQRETSPVYLTDEFWAFSSERNNTSAGSVGDPPQPSWKTGRASLVGQFSYAYAKKYLASFSFREDGSMNFAPNQRWGFFPAGSVGWVVSEESFFNKEKINHLKLRASVGLTGNDAVGGWQWQQSYVAAKNASFGETPTRNVGIKYGSVVNPNLTWEKSLTYNIGVDMDFFKHFNTTLEYWNRDTYDILGNRTISTPTSFSLTLPAENYGEVRAQGFDFSVGYNNKVGEFAYHVDATMSYGWNKVIIKDYAENALPYDVPIGKATEYLKGYRFDKILRTQQDLDAFNAAHPSYNIGGIKPDLGMMVYKDLSGPNGVPDNNIDKYDVDVLINDNFPVIYGLNLGGNWKGLSLDLVFNGKLNYQKSMQQVTQSVEWNRSWQEWYDNSWTPENTNAMLPKQIGYYNGGITYSSDSDFWLKSANFIRLKYMNLSYTIPKKIFKNLVENVKVYATGSNLFVLSNFTYYDPEGGPFNFPASRTFGFGVNVSL